MKKYILKAFAVVAFSLGLSACGEKFLETDYYAGIDSEGGLSNVDNIAYALNGTYYRLFYYYFAGNYAINIGDIPTDITYWNAGTSHFNAIYTYTVTDTDSYLESIWNYGYKVTDNATRVINAAQELYESCSEDEQVELSQYMAEAYGLRAYAELLLVNIYAHQVKVAGTDYSSWPGIVVIDEEPVAAYSEVSRSTVGESYVAILSDLENSLACFDAAGGDRGSILYFNRAAVYGLLARTNLYLENWSNARQYAQEALDEKGITELTYDAAAYASLFSGNESNTESMLSLAITSNYNWSANSCGTLWTTYDYSPSPKLQAMYGENDIRTSIFGWDESSTESVPEFTGGKYSQHSSGNPAYATNYLVNAPEMFLIMAEADAELGNVSSARSSLLTVAKRDADITSVDDLPSTADGLLSFIKDERARELFQEGLRLYDLRRWGDPAEVYAYQAPNISFTYTNYQISDLVYPIPSDEVTAGFGVEQNENWSSTLPR